MAQSTTLSEAKNRFSALLESGPQEIKPSPIVMRTLNTKLTPTRGRPKKRKAREKILTFDIRQKPFELPESVLVGSMPLYSLARAWLVGRYYPFDLFPPETPVSEPEECSIEAYTIRDVYQLPAPVPARKRPLKPLAPMPNAETVYVDVNSQESLLRAHMIRWKGAKRQWMSYVHKRDERFGKSLRVLQAIYSAGQQRDDPGEFGAGHSEPETVR